MKACRGSATTSLDRISHCVTTKVQDQWKRLAFFSNLFDTLIGEWSARATNWFDTVMTTSILESLAASR